MKHEVKYRGWFQSHTGEEYWVYGYPIKQPNGNWEITDGTTYWTVDEVFPYIGKKDSKGKEIYLGANVAVIMEDIHFPSSYIENKGKIIYNNEFCCYGFTTQYGWLDFSSKHYKKITVID
jgi:hypothetical protein